MTRQRRDRRLAWLLAAVAAALAAGRLWLLQGLTTPLEIDGGSMAEALPGRHIQFTCTQCSRVWSIDAAQAEDAYLACPECGQRVDEQTPRAELPAARVVIDRAAYLLAQPQRFDAVACRAPDSSDLAVKRIVALPGEAWRIEEGELFIGDEIVRKSFSQFRETATLVAATPRRWRGDEGSHWRCEGDRWTCAASAGATDWLTYHHVAAHPAAQDKASPVQDLDPYNPALGRQLNEVRDLVGQCRLTASEVVLQFRIHGYLLRWNLAAGQAIARRGEEQLASTSTARGPRHDSHLAWGLCDGRLWLVINEQIVLQHELPGGSVNELSAAPLALGVSGSGDCQIQDLQVWRDIYYLDPQQRAGSWQSEPLDADEYALLGDNPPLSVDSRMWERGVRGGVLLGRVWRR